MTERVCTVALGTRSAQPSRLPPWAARPGLGRLPPLGRRVPGRRRHPPALRRPSQNPWPQITFSVTTTVRAG